MSWQYSDAPSHIAPEVGPNLLTGAGPWSDIALAPEAVYVLSVEVNAPGETTVGWGVTVTDGGGGEYVLADPADGETVPGGQWVTVTRNLPAPGFPTTAAVTLAVPTGTQARNPSMGARTGRTILTVPGDVLAENIMASGGIVAGTPGGARVEMTEDGLVSYDSTGAETARIAGEGGEFVGGEFRTSDSLPGQVTLSDTAYRASYDGVLDGPGDPAPGIRITPIDTTGVAIPPGIGPTYGGVRLDGGLSTSGSRASVTASSGSVTIGASQDDGAHGSAQVSAALSILRSRAADGSYGETYVDPAQATLRTYRDDGTKSSSIEATSTAARMLAYREDGTVAGDMQSSPTDSRMRTYSGNSSEAGWIRTQPQDAELAYVDPNNTYFSRVRADADEAHLYTRAGGTNRYLRVNATGIWVESGENSYNLEETASVPAPEIVPVTGSNGWSAAGSPTGGIIVTHSKTGRVCTARLRLTRTGDPVTFGGTYQTIGSAPGSATMWIPPELRIPATDYFGIRIPVSQPATGILFVDFATGEFRVKADTSATIDTGRYITVNMTWFIPN